MWTYGWGFLALCPYADKSCAHKHCDNGHMFLICYVTSREHMFKGLCEFMGGIRLRSVTTLPFFVTIGLVKVTI